MEPLVPLFSILSQFGLFTIIYQNLIFSISIIFLPFSKFIFESNLIIIPFIAFFFTIIYDIVDV
jgi:hypothetical protein